MTDEATTPALKPPPRIRPTVRGNITCVYCGKRSEPGNRLTDEHVIGKLFVPTGKLTSGWFLQLRACNRCNKEKSDLENDISAITQLPDLGITHTDPDLAKEVVRKARGSTSHRTGKPIAKSYERFEIAGHLMPGAGVLFGLVGPPQIDEERVLRLAYFHVQGFFYLATYRADSRTGGFLPGEMCLLNYAMRPDWGNSLQRSFAQLTRDWLSSVECDCADGFFRIAIRRDPSGTKLCSFALEWNKNLRTIGFFGDPERAEVHVDALPPRPLQQFDSTLRGYQETPLDPAEDILFKPVSPST